MKRPLWPQFAAALTLAASAALAGDTSVPTHVFLAPKRSFLWCTATNATITLPIVFPEGATSASLSVSGLRYAATYANLAEGDFTLSLPAATSPSTENVFDLTLTFAGSDVIRTARLGEVQGIAVGASTTAARCYAPATARRWRRVERQAVAPIPCGATSFSFTPDGGATVTETGLDGAAGWYAFAMPNGSSATASLIDGNGVEYDAFLQGLSYTLLLLR